MALNAGAPDRALALSIIVPAYDEAAVIRATLESLHTAARALDVPYEIIVVDDGSTDGTGNLAAGCGAIVRRVERRQIAAVRNDGAAIARGERFVFVDADTIVPPPVLAAAWRALDDGAVGGGAFITFDGHVPLVSRVALAVFSRLFLLFQYTGGCFIYATRADFEAVGGFDETLFASEEVALAKALKKRGRFRVVHEAVITSGRKVRQYRLRELLAIMFRQALRGPRRAWRDREGLDVWYGPRRKDDPNETSWGG